MYVSVRRPELLDVCGKPLARYHFSPESGKLTSRPASHHD